MQLAFDLTADGGAQFGGWTLDDVGAAPGGDGGPGGVPAGCACSSGTTPVSSFVLALLVFGLVVL